MSLTNDSFETAKRKATERLRGWVASIQDEKQSGIPKLRREFKNVFKTIKWLPKNALFEKEFSSETTPNEIDIKMCRASASEKEGTRTVVTGMSAVLLEDHQIHDSNSSNLSSSLGFTKEEIKLSEGKSSRSRTPYTKTPLLILEDENRCKLTVQEKKPTTLPPLQDRKLSLDKSKKGKRNFLIPELQPRVASFHRRRKARARKTIRKAGDKLSANTDGDSDKDLVATETKQGSSLSAVQTISSLRQNSSSLLVSKGSSHKDQSDSPRNKALSRGGVHKRSRLDKRQKTDGSKQEITVENLTSEEKRQEVLDNFRRMVRLLIHVRVLLNVSRIRISEEEKSKEFKRFDDGKEISFDPTAFKSTVTYGGLPARARIVLKKTPSERTEEDARVLNDLMARLPVFSKYPKSVKKSLAKTMWYDMFQDGRVILKQGDPGSRMYFVVSGEVELHRTDVVDTGEFIRYHLQTMSAGSTFGEIALMRNMRREFTAVCKGTSEFLSLSKDEFNQALRYRLERDCNIRYDFLRSCDLFKDWTDKQLQICADSSEIKEYKNNMVIAGDTNGPSDGVYFVRRGLCDIVRRIVLVRHQSPYLRPNILLPQTAAKRQNFLNKTYSRGRRLRRDEVRFITVTTLQPGNYFGAGENLRDTFILSRGNTDCVVINPAQFSIQGKSEQLRRMKRSRDRDLPNNNVLYAEFQNNRKWHEYRNQLIHDIIERKKNPHVGRIEDVPRSILNKPAIPADLIYFKSVSNSLN